MKNPQTKSRGFTLIELLVVIAIIGILASVVLASLSSARSKARDAALAAQVEEFTKALEIYYLQNGRYPSDGSSAGSAVISDYLSGSSDVMESYISSFPTPENEVRYQSMSDGTGAGYRIGIIFENGNTFGAGSNGSCQIVVNTPLINWGTSYPAVACDL